MTRTGSPARTVVTALGTTALLAVLEPDALEAAQRVMHAELAAIDVACSRFRPDSEISRLLAGTATPVGPLLAEAIAVALLAAQQTDGMVDPTVGHAVRALGYDRDFADIDLDGADPLPAPQAAPGGGASAGTATAWCSRAAWRSTWAPPPKRCRPTASRPGPRRRPARVCW